MTPSSVPGGGPSPPRDDADVRRRALEDADDRDNRRIARWALFLAIVPAGASQLLALVLASLTLGRAHPGGRPMSGRGWARAAQVVALLMMFPGGVLLGWWVFVLRPGQVERRTEERYQACCSNLRAIAIACRRFRDGPGARQRYPSGWLELASFALIEPERLTCPGDFKTQAGESSYRYLGDQPRFTAPAQFVLAFEKHDNHPSLDGERFLAVFGDERVEWLANDRLQALLSTQVREP